MKHVFFGILVALVFSAALTCAPVFAQQKLEPLTNASVIKLVRAGFKEKTVISIIHSRHNRFDLNAERLIELKHNGVTENIILAMISQDELPLSTGDDWGDYTSFRRGPGAARANGNSAPKQDGVDIFGSSGSSSGESHGRGQSGSNQGESVTTGSATVRILRPPSEEGSSAVKLEKTPTLNNDSIIKLVDAGFSEGTIVKRIEDSPSDFDLSPAKLAELRRHRVGESVITAMTSAMSDDSNTRGGTPAKSREN